MPAAPDIGPAVAAVRSVAAWPGVTRVVALVDRGDETTPAVVDAGPGGVETTVAGEPVAAEATQPPPGVPRPVQVPPMRVDPDRGEVKTAFGALEALAGAVHQLAAALPGRSVATVEIRTDDPELPVTLAARAGEPMLIAFGGREFELEPPTGDDAA
jgi:hypothetical protein